MSNVSRVALYILYIVTFLSVVANYVFHLDIMTLNFQSITLGKKWTSDSMVQFTKVTVLIFRYCDLKLTNICSKCI